MRWLVVIAALALLSSPNTETRYPMTASRKAFEAFYARLPLTSSQRMMLTLIAYGESRFNIAVHNDSPGEVAASVRAYARVRAKLEGCSSPASEYQIGSGGWFGRLVPYFVDDLMGVVPCISPSAIFSDPAAVLVSGVRNCGRLQRYDAYRADPTACRLRAGFLSLRAMADVPPDRAAKYARHARELGFPSSFIASPVDPFPTDDATLAQWYALLRGSA